MGAPHPLLSGETSPPGRRTPVLAGALFVWAAALFVAGVVLAAVNGFPLEQSWGDAVTSFFFPLVPLVFAGAGLAIARQNRRHPLAWICLAIGVSGLGPVFPPGYAHYSLVTNPASLPFGVLSAWMEEWAWVIWAALAGVFFVLLFPDGKLPSPRWKGAAGLGLAAAAMSFAAVAFQPGRLQFNPAVNPVGLDGSEAVLGLLAGGLILLPIAILLALTSLVLRFVRSSGEERLQLKWLVSAFSGVAMMHVASALSTVGYATVLGPAPPYPAASGSTIAVIQGVATMTWITVPVAAAIAVCRYRLDAIDRVIRNLVAGLVVAAVLVAGYAGAVLALSLLIDSSPRPGLASSVAAAALVLLMFVPVRAWAVRLADWAVTRRGPIVEGRSTG